MTRFLFFTHFCDCRVKTELIYRNNCAKNSFNRFEVGAIVYRQFSTTFAWKHSSGQWTRGSEDWMSAFCECQHHLFHHFVPFTLWTIFTDRRPLFLWSRPVEWPLSCSKSLCIERDESNIWLAFFIFSQWGKVTRWPWHTLYVGKNSCTKTHSTNFLADLITNVMLQDRRSVGEFDRILSCCPLITMRCRWTSTWRWSVP